MLKCAEDQCPHVLAEANIQEDIRHNCREKSQVSPEFVQTCVLEQAGTDIMNKVK